MNVLELGSCCRQECRAVVVYKNLTGEVAFFLCHKFERNVRSDTEHQTVPQRTEAAVADSDHFESAFVWVVSLLCKI